MPGNVSSRLRDEIEEAILTGKLPPGARLDEMSLAEKHKVSRTPIREALMQLAAAGLVHVQPRKGATVTELPPNRLIEMFEVMAQLEGMAARLAARRHTHDDKAELLAAFERCKQAAENGDDEAYYCENEQLHLAIYAASHNVFLSEQCQQLHRRLKPYRRLQLRVRMRVATSLAEHREIVNAVLNLDADHAERLARQHVVVQGERFADLLASLHSRVVEAAPDRTSATGS